VKLAIVFVAGLSVGLSLVLLVPHGAPQVVSAAGEPSGNGDVNASGAIDIADAVYLLSYLFAQGPAPVAIESPACDSCCLPCPPGGLPATGQDKCYDNAGNVVDCASADYPGQDGFYRAGCSTAGRFVDNGDDTVTDTCTGLMWQKATAPGMYTWQAALKYCDGLALGGRDDWRLPNINELHSLVRYDNAWPTPAIDPVFTFPTDVWWYWSSSSAARGPSSAWFLNFAYGNANGNDGKTDGGCVRAVRGGL
jgi:hypothetical protein